MSEEKQYQLIEAASNLSTIPVGGIASRILHNDSRVRVVLLGLSAGMEWRELQETNPYPTMFQIVTGEGRLTLEDQEVEFGQGAWFHIEAGQAYLLCAATELLLVRTDVRVDDD